MEKIWNSAAVLLMLIPSLVNAEIYSCVEGGQKVLRSEPCGNAIISKPVLPPAAQGRSFSDSRNEIVKPSAGRQLSIEELRANCPADFDALAANLGDGNPDDRITYNHKLAMVKAKCASSTVECYEDFGALQRIRFGSINLDDKVRVKQVIAATRAKCGIQTEPKSTMNCRVNPGGLQFGLNCR